MPGAAPKTDYWDHFWQKGEASCCDDRPSPGHADAVDRVWRHLIDKVNEAKASVCHHRDRLRALVDAALAEDGMREVVGLAARIGLIVEAFSPIEADGTKVAWRLDAARAGEGS